MLLQLYKQPYFDQTKPHEFRLLFEAVMESSVRREDNDFYLYVWIGDDHVLSAFQAVLDNELVLEYRPPGPLTYSRISTNPIQRSVFAQQSKAEQKRMRAVMKDLKCDHFTSCIESISRLISGAVKEPAVLTESEKTEFNALTKTAGGK
ncbi:MAG: hypothetical protein PHC61_13955 [Chitinivibrionales bacterium]|nr:hypothetical protein [Chitinivibrionales bacterium]